MRLEGLLDLGCQKIPHLGTSHSLIGSWRTHDEVLMELILFRGRGEGGKLEEAWRLYVSTLMAAW
jgi:hypothetical protein